MFKILLISNAPFSSWSEVGILKRNDFNVLYEKNFEDGFQKILKEKFDLFIAEESPFDNSFLIFVNQILNQVKIPSLKGILICSSTRNLKELGPFKKILYTPLEPESLTEAIAYVLNLKRRVSRRYIVRMHLGMSEDNIKLIQTCVTINLNKGGMLIETTKSLPLEKTFWWTFQGVKELEGLSIKGKIVNEAPQEGFSLNFRYGIKFDEECRDAIKKIEKYLEENF